MSDLTAPGRWRSLLAIVALRRVPFWTATPRRRWLRRLLMVVYVYPVLLLVLVFFEHRLIFPGWTMAQDWHAPPPGARELDLTTDLGDTVKAWWLPPEGWEPRQGAVLFAHGNGSNVSY